MKIKYSIIILLILLNFACSNDKKSSILNPKDTNVLDSQVNTENPIVSDTIVEEKEPLVENNALNDNKISKKPLVKKEETTLNKLIGKHIFGIQFIYNSWGSATVTSQNGELSIIGRQFSKDKKEYAKIDGDLKIVDDRTLHFDGRIRIFTEGCCGVIDTTGKFTFYKKDQRKYYRLQNFDALCSQYTCAYYLDIFDR